MLKGRLGERLFGGGEEDFGGGVAPEPGASHEVPRTARQGEERRRARGGRARSGRGHDRAERGGPRGLGTARAGDGRGDRGEAEKVESLTPREIEVLRLLSQGQTNPPLARDLTVSRGTVKIHVQRIILSKLTLCQPHPRPPCARSKLESWMRIFGSLGALQPAAWLVGTLRANALRLSAWRFAPLSRACFAGLLAAFNRQAWGRGCRRQFSSAR